MQLSDDLDLLRLMMRDLYNSPKLYQPTNYWSAYEREFIPELERLGLNDFRRRTNSVLGSFGATDLSPRTGNIDLTLSKVFRNTFLSNVTFLKVFIKTVNKLLNKTLPMRSTNALKEYQELLFEFAVREGQLSNARPITEINPSLIGNPEHIIVRDGNSYTESLIKFYLQYCYVCRHLNFNDVNILIELGSGSGTQIEVIKKLHPDICILLFDIPPQLYVCEKYLSAVFPDSVVSYRDTRNLNDLPACENGKIFIFGTESFPIIENLPVDLFWNSASFQEMEPDVVENYLHYVNNSSKSVYLKETMKGKEIAVSKGGRGVLAPTTIDDYRRGLTNFDLCDLSSITWPLGKRNIYSDSFWLRKR